MRLVVRSSIVILLAVLARPAVGRDLYVNNQSGDDGATGHQPRVMPDRTGPVKTIVKALRLAQNGDRVVLAATGQPYRESVSFVGSRNGGTPSQRFVLQGSGAILDGSAPVPAYAWEHYRGAVFRFRPLNAEYQQLFFEDRPQGCSPAGSPTLRPNSIRANGACTTAISTSAWSGTNCRKTTG